MESEFAKIIYAKINGIPWQTQSAKFVSRQTGYTVCNYKYMKVANQFHRARIKFSSWSNLQEKYIDVTRSCYLIEYNLQSLWNKHVDRWADLACINKTHSQILISWIQYNLQSLHLWSKGILNMHQHNTFVIQ
jgi:hypothetical protein